MHSNANYVSHFPYMHMNIIPLSIGRFSQYSFYLTNVKLITHISNLISFAPMEQIPEFSVVENLFPAVSAKLCECVSCLPGIGCVVIHCTKTLTEDFAFLMTSFIFFNNLYNL